MVGLNDLRGLSDLNDSVILRLYETWTGRCTVELEWPSQLKKPGMSLGNLFNPSGHRTPLNVWLPQRNRGSKVLSRRDAVPVHQHSSKQPLSCLVGMGSWGKHRWSPVRLYDMIFDYKQDLNIALGWALCCQGRKRRTRTRGGVFSRGQRRQAGRAGSGDRTQGVQTPASSLMQMAIPPASLTKSVDQRKSLIDTQNCCANNEPSALHVPSSAQDWSQEPQPLWPA